MINPKQLQDQSDGSETSPEPGTPLSQEDFLRKIEKARNG